MLHLEYPCADGDLTDSTNICSILARVHPDELYNLGAQSHVKVPTFVRISQDLSSALTSRRSERMTSMPPPLPSTSLHHTCIYNRHFVRSLVFNFALAWVALGLWWDGWCGLFCRPVLWSGEF
jgi:hypothetical protein